MTFRILRWICILGLSVAACQPRLTPTPSPVPTPTAVAIGKTPSGMQDLSGVGSTDGIVILATVILALIVLTALVRHQDWLREESEEEEE